MTTRTMMSLSLSALLLGGTMVGCATSHSVLASAGAPGRMVENAAAAKAADSAREAIARGDNAKAVRFAEQAVAGAPRDADYRALLGRSYLQAGRFASASQALGDALMLDPANGKAALNLALAQTALGDWVPARKTLSDHADTIAPADRGLALALAGDPKTAVGMLSVLARKPSANATTRQNLALALALAGKWREAKAVASVDVAPNELDARIQQWAAFVRPNKASDQVASLLGVQPSVDTGQPAQLALNRAEGTRVAAVAPVDPVAAPVPAPITDKSAQAVPANDPAPTEVAVAQLASSGPAISFAPRHEIVQPIPAHPAEPKAPVATASTKPVSPAKPAPLAKGDYYVQLGAYDSAAVAKDKWHHLSRHIARLGDVTPSGMAATVHGRRFYRLSVGGYSRASARSLCHAVKANGGRCFVRADAGDRVAQWVRGNVQVASR